jgi:hypothetical protein
METDRDLDCALRSDGWKILCTAPGCGAPHHWVQDAAQLATAWIVSVDPLVRPILDDLPAPLIERLFPRRRPPRAERIAPSYSTRLAHQLSAAVDQHELTVLCDGIAASADLTLQEYGRLPNHEYLLNSMIWRPASSQAWDYDFGLIVRTGKRARVDLALAMTLDEFMMVTGTRDLASRLEENNATLH